MSKFIATVHLGYYVNVEVEAENEDQALDYALARENIVSSPQYEQEDWESVDEYLDEVDITEIEYQQEEGV